MEKFEESRQNAVKYFKTADHLISVTYNVVKDAKLLVAILENLNLSLQETMNSILYHDRLFKKIPPFQDSFESRYNMFRLKCARHYNLETDYIMAIAEVKEMLDEHRKAPVEFVKNDKFIICNETYNMKALSMIDIKKYLARAKLFIQEANIITTKDETVFK
jgi:hypothetical protein